MWSEYYNVADIDTAIQILAKYGPKARIVAGATDLLLEIDRGVRKDIEILIDLSRAPGLDAISQDPNGMIHIGPNVTHNQCVGSKIITEKAKPLAMACWNVGSPQIRNRGTIAGNVITASPANDTIPALMALNTVVVLQSHKGTREIPLNQFYTGVRKTVMRDDELLAEIRFQGMGKNQQGIFLKYALRNAQAISLINTAVIVSWDGNKISSALISLGAVTPTVIHATEAEKFLVGKKLSDKVIEDAALLAASASKPIDDLRSSKNHRTNMVKILVTRALQAINLGDEQYDLPERPPMLWGKSLPDRQERTVFGMLKPDSPIHIKVNGKIQSTSQSLHKSLLHLLRDDLNLKGTKEGCGEGECGACTIFLDGKAVMGCLVPAGRAQGATVETIESIGNEKNLHPVQQAFVDEGAVQCGYCTPGFIMSAVKMLQENPKPSPEEIMQAITGNLCRCTGYYKIVQAIEKAAEKIGE